MLNLRHCDGVKLDLSESENFDYIQNRETFLIAISLYESSTYSTDEKAFSLRTEKGTFEIFVKILVASCSIAI